MPALRNGHPALLPRNRRRSSHMALFTPAKPGIYGVGVQHRLPSPATPPSSLSQLPPRPISFAPNVTPVSYVESEDSSPSTPEPLSPNALPKLFPPSETPAPPPARKRCPPGKRRSQGYIPRPPNAFMLFRADFVRQKHVPGSIETNHGSLSKIIGNCWRSLPLEEKKVWESRAKHEKAAHKLQYPNYRFRPVHNKNKKKTLDDNSSAYTTSHDNDKKKQDVSPEEEMRCEEVTQLLLEGKKGEELARAVRELEDRRKRRLQEVMKLKAQSMTPGPIPSPLNMPSRHIGFSNGIMSAPQPTYPNSMLPGGNDSFFPGDNQSTGSYLHLRRSSSVPVPGHYTNGGFDFSNLHFPSNFPMNGNMGYDYFMAPPPAYSENPQHGDQATDSSGIAIPSVPFLPPPSSSGISGLANSSMNTDGTMEDSTHLGIASISKQQRAMLGHRRSSSAGPAFGGLQRSWTTPFPTTNYGYGYFDADGSSLDSGDYGAGNIVLQRDDSPLPDVDLSLFDPNFLNGSSVTASHSTPAPEDPAIARTNPGTTHTTPNGAFSVTELVHGLPNSLGPLDTTGYQQHSHMQGGPNAISPHDVVNSANEQYWSNNGAQNMYQSQGLGLETGPNDMPPSSTAGSPPGAGSYDQMPYLNDAPQHPMAQMDMGYHNANSYPDSGSYGFDPMDMTMHMSNMQNPNGQYVPC